MTRLLVLVLALAACAVDDVPVEETAQPVSAQPGPDTDECTFLFPVACRANLTPADEQRVCHEHLQPDGYTRQSFGSIHCSTLAGCDGGAGDIHGYRICLPGGGGQMTPCGTTGPNGCAGCEVHATCH